ncbi:MAG TPA: Stp1/IreP family PP2C-type Ser/Thr phosphatase, partial [Actinomycetota bacterium]|nr:Stp1/IreP family PP2C-type Ser/Thr phosphatase [Actinomycetota bacterium]
DIGRVRKGTEDSFLVEPPLYAVADGMGGHRGGDVASQLALETVERMFREGHGTLEEQIREANRAVFARSAEDRSVAGMGTTLTAALVREGQVHLAHVGDSRAYLLRAGALRQLTRDHTLVDRMLRAGEISEAEAEVHPHRNVLTRVVGTEPDVSVDERDVGLLEGDRLLLCSDGLTNMVTEDQIQAILEATPTNPQEAADRLVRAANRAGGVDNITVLVLDLVGDDTDGADVIGVPTATVPAGIASGDPDADAGSVTTAGASRPERDRRTPAVGRVTLIRWALALLAVFVVLGAGFAVFRAWVDDRWYVGVENGNVAIFRGIPAEIVGFDLSRVELETAIPAEDAMALPAYEGLADGINQNDQAEAEALVEQIRLDLRAQERADRDGGGGADGGGAGGGGANGGGNADGGGGGGGAA